MLQNPLFLVKLKLIFGWMKVCKIADFIGFIIFFVEWSDWIVGTLQTAPPGSVICLGSLWTGSNPAFPHVNLRGTGDQIVVQSAPQASCLPGWPERCHLPSHLDSPTSPVITHYGGMNALHINTPKSKLNKDLIMSQYWNVPGSSLKIGSKKHTFWKIFFIWHIFLKGTVSLKASLSEGRRQKIFPPQIFFYPFLDHVKADFGWCAHHSIT